MHGLVKIQQCHSGVVHLTVGATTIHMDAEAFATLAETVGRFCEESMAGGTRGAPGILRLIKDHIKN